LFPCSVLNSRVISQVVYTHITILSSRSLHVTSAIDSVSLNDSRTEHLTFIKALTYITVLGTSSRWGTCHCDRLPVFFSDLSRRIPGQYLERGHSRVVRPFSVYHYHIWHEITSVVCLSLLHNERRNHPTCFKSRSSETDSLVFRK